MLFFALTGMVAWGVSGAAVLWLAGCAVMDAWRERKALKAKHADVDALAKQTKAMSARSARVWQHIPDDEHAVDAFI